MKTRRHVLVLVALLTLSLTAFAQKGKKQTVAYYRADSILPLTNSFKAKNDSMTSYNLKIQETLTTFENEYQVRLKALYADSAVVTAEYYALKKAEVDAIKDNCDAFREAAKAEGLRIDSMLTQTALLKIQSAAETAVKRTKYKKVHEQRIAVKMAAEPGTNYTLVDITDLVIQELKSNGEIR